MKQPKGRFRYLMIDSELQGTLLVALVLLESMMLLGAVGYLYLQFAHLMDQGLYQAHAPEEDQLLWSMLKAFVLVVGIMAAVNTLALILAHMLWTRHIHGVLAALCARLARLKVFDLRAASQSAHAHPLLRELEAWRAGEEARWANIDQLLAGLPPPETPLSAEECQRMSRTLAEARLRLRPAIEEPPTG